ncbi:DUF590-domain-containing protein [Cutaneotrichosporon oleaginosum]|uniref:DUF590-domain-containing protein n=1 Tax=Cutaneotrichosporon oleaginosum TaxID=879819 RepID=A0A0J0XKF0_9TREE|nr:DUF590-domain-containing protein [Cutaneotrichosporon oleaginosum]KLT41542.1 DUF590-domain-containing protein [Cutaneotrichosporon oleaginosum]TXT09310.1 hypothetical protein COLE_03244 [Cutaneotrichosporon oleaginosum]
MGAGDVDTSNPFHVDLVIPFDISLRGAERRDALYDTQGGYSRLIAALESVPGLRIAARPGRGGKDAEDLWVFVGASDAKVAELAETERVIDKAYGMIVPNRVGPVSPATRFRLLYDLLTAPGVQDGLGITPGEGEWSRVKSIMALHDEAADNKWVERWAVGGDWQIGLLRGLDEKDEDLLSRNQPPPVRLYFNYLTTYTMSLMPLCVISVGFWLFTPADSFPPLYAFALAIYSTVFIAAWRVREKKLAVRWGTRGCETRRVGRMRPQYVINQQIQTLDQPHHKADLVRDGKMVASIPVVISCGILLGIVLMCIFMLEAFISQLWHGPGKAIIGFVPMVLFSGVVPQVMAAFSQISAKLVHWEDHRTWTSATRSLTAKTFAMNAIVAYLGLYLSSYVYLPFGPYIMAHIQKLLFRYQGPADAQFAAAEKPGAIRAKVNSGRLRAQVFAYTVTNQVINTFLEIGLPFILRHVNDVRSGKAGVLDIFKGGKKENEKAADRGQDVEKRFLDKVEAELALPEYNIFVDYAEMVTQFGYVVIWSIVWPIAPLFALVNNYFELRSDALKISKHVRRPLGDRVETIGTWIDALSIIAWMGAWTSTTLIELFRPRRSLLGVRKTVANFLASHDVAPTFSQIVPTLIPVAFYALAASHGYFILRAVVNGVAERVFWRGSPEELAEEQARANMSKSGVEDVIDAHEDSQQKRNYTFPQEDAAFWDGGKVGVQEIVRVLKTE